MDAYTCLDSPPAKEGWMHRRCRRGGSSRHPSLSKEGSLGGCLHRPRLPSCQEGWMHRRCRRGGSSRHPASLKEGVWVSPGTDYYSRLTTDMLYHSRIPNPSERQNIMKNLS